MTNSTPPTEFSAEQRAEIVGRTTRTITWLTGGAFVLIVGLLGWAFVQLGKSQVELDIMRWYVLSIIAIAGTLALGGVFIKMQRGIRQQNLRAVGIVLVLVLASLLAVTSDSYEPVYGLLGAVAGYLFGKDKAAEGERDG